MSTPEAIVKAKVRKILDAYTPVWYFMPVMGGYGVSGVPDFVCCVAGKFLVIECKAGKNKQTVMQELIMDKIQGANGYYMLVNEINTKDVGFVLMHFGASPKINETLT